MAVVGALGEQRLEDLDEGLDALAAVVEPRRQALLEIAGGGVVREVERARIPAQQIAVLLGDAFVDVDDVEAGAR
jgi:hypothetical protein